MIRSPSTSNVEHRLTRRSRGFASVFDILTLCTLSIPPQVCSWHFKSETSKTSGLARCLREATRVGGDQKTLADPPSRSTSKFSKHPQAGYSLPSSSFLSLLPLLEVPEMSSSRSPPSDLLHALRDSTSQTFEAILEEFALRALVKGVGSREWCSELKSVLDAVCPPS